MVRDVEFRGASTACRGLRLRAGVASRLKIGDIVNPVEIWEAAQ